MLGAAIYVKLTILKNTGDCCYVFVFNSKAVCLNLRIKLEKGFG